MNPAGQRWDFSGIRPSPPPPNPEADTAGNLPVAASPAGNAESPSPNGSEPGIPSIQETHAWESSNSSSGSYLGSSANADSNSAQVSNASPALAQQDPATMTDRQWLELVFAPRGRLDQNISEILLRTQRLPRDFVVEWRAMVPTLNSLADAVQPRLSNMQDHLNQLSDLITVHNAHDNNRITALERNTEHLIPLPGLLDELNNRHEENRTTIATLVRDCHTMAEHGGALTAVQANMAEMLNQIYVDLQTQRTAVQGLASHVGYVAPRVPNPPQIAANAAPNNAAPQPQAAHMPAGNEYLGILAAVVLVCAVAMIKLFETLQAY